MRGLTLEFAIALVVGSAPVGAKLCLALAIDLIGGTWDAAPDPLLLASIGLIGAGAIGLSLTGAAPLHRRSTRVGLCIFALGLLSCAAAWFATRDLSGEEILSSPALVAEIGGLLAGILGALVTAVSLAISPDDRSRAVGFGLLGGFLIPVMPVLGVALMILGCAGVGLLALARAYAPAPGATNI